MWGTVSAASSRTENDQVLENISTDSHQVSGDSSKYQDKSTTSLKTFVYQDTSEDSNEIVGYIYTSQKELVVRSHNTELKKQDTSTWQDELAAKYCRT